LDCWAAGGRIEIHSLYTDISDWPWEFRVYLPPCYDEQTSRRYPTLYLIHGSTYNDDQWDRLGADETADRLIARGEIPPFLIVMPRDRVWTEPDEDPFGQAVTEYILPWVESEYRTLSGREQRAVGGLSRGAAWAVHLGLSRWELFGAIGAHSLPVFWSDTGKIRQWIDEIPAGQTPRIYLDIGEQDYLIRSARWFENLLTELGVAHEWYLFPGVHEEAYWRAHLETYLRWYARDW
jgi:enterochelin esterase-like enzyme